MRVLMRCSAGVFNPESGEGMHSDLEVSATDDM